MTNLILKRQICPWLAQTLLISHPNPSPLSLSDLWLPFSLTHTHGGSLSLTYTHGDWRLLLLWPKPIFSTTIFYSFFKSMPWRHLARDFRASHHHYCYCSMPTSLIWCQMCLGLCFWVWISIYGFRSLFLGLGLCLCLGLCVKRQGNVWQTPTNSATTIDDATTGGHWSLSSFFVLVFFFFFFSSLSLSLFFFFFFFFFFWFGSWSIYGLGFLMWYLDLVIFYLGLKGGLGMAICRFVGIFWLRVCLKMALIWWFC